MREMGLLDGGRSSEKQQARLGSTQCGVLWEHCSIHQARSVGFGRCWTLTSIGHALDDSVDTLLAERLGCADLECPVIIKEATKPGLLRRIFRLHP